jgi:CBS domain-containing protein
MLIREVMTSPAVTVSPYTTEREALRLLEECCITALPVVDDGVVVGVVSEADLLALVPPGRPSDPLPAGATSTHRVRELMTHPAITVDADSEVTEAFGLMRSTMIKSLPVVLNARIVGVVSRSDLVRLLAHTDERICHEITGRVHAEGVNWLVDVTNGVATITGPVTDRQRRDAEAIARSVIGVVDVRVHGDPW